MLSRRGLLAGVGRSAPLLAAGGVLGRLALPMQALAPKATAVAQDLDEVPAHPAIVGWVDGEEVYDTALVYYLDGNGWMIRAPGQLWAEAQGVGRGAILVRTAGGGHIARWAINDAMQLSDDLTARFLPRAVPAALR